MKLLYVQINALFVDSTSLKRIHLRMRVSHRCVYIPQIRAIGATEKNKRTLPFLFVYEKSSPDAGELFAI